MYQTEKTLTEEAKEMRTVFAEVMEELVQQDDRVVYLDADIINSIGMTDFWKAHPERTVNCGIQEANMIGTAAGMSATGLVPFVHTFGPFATRRVMDQVFISAAYAKLNVRIIGSDPGVTASTNGGTHMPFEDMGMMRCVPGVTVLEPTDSVMLADLMRQTKDQYGVFYIRLSRKKAEKIFIDGSTFEIGKAAKLREGKDVTIFATGISVADSLRAANMLAAEGVSAGVSNIFTIKPVDRDAIVEAATATGAIVTAENHNVIGGLGSAVSEVLTDTVCCPLERVGVQDRFGEVGDVNYLKKELHLTAGDIAAAAKRVIARKKG
ncbi:MAG: transketolase family protein [Clostridiaceae bacterium]|nr:transketolase family protein [Clostridiaceae bacterium]